MTPRFHRLQVADRRQETADAVSLAFAVPPDLADAYRFDAGQYLTLRQTLDGEEQRRSYSICAAPYEGELRIAVKQVPGGLMSTWLNAVVKPGDWLDVMTPTGRFGLQPQPDASRTILAIAAGSGITPILAIIRDLLHREPHSTLLLFNGNRRLGDVMFREALDDLKDTYLSRFVLTNIYSRERQDVDILSGRLGAENFRQMLTATCQGKPIDAALLCGPEDMIVAITATLQTLGLSETQIHTERFVSASGGRPRCKPADLPTSITVATAQILLDGRQTEIALAPGETVLEAALRAGLDLPFACKAGMCCTCRAKLVSGSVEMEANYSLTPTEVAEGFVLTCQSRPTAPTLVVDFDHS